MNSKQLGILGEKIAENYLKKKGYQILDKNYVFRIPQNPQKGEIDIVAKKGDIISFFEVKTLIKNSQDYNPPTTSSRLRRAPRFSAISPEEKVDFSKKRKLIKTAESWLMKNKIPFNSKWQIDVISLRIDLSSKKAKISHFKNAIA